VPRRGGPGPSIVARGRAAIIRSVPLLGRDDGVEIHWQERGSGPLVVLMPYCISHPSVFDPLEAELAADHRVVRYDDRGTGASTHRGPYDMQTGAADLEAVVEAVGGSAVVVALADSVNRAVRVAASRPDLVHATIVPGGNPAGRRALEGTDAMVSSDSVVDAFISMAETDYRGAVRSVTAAGNPQMSEEEIRERVALQVSYQPQDSATARLRAWVEDDASEQGRQCGDRLWLLFADDAGGGWFPVGDEGRRLARRLFPQARVERIEDGIVSRPDLTAAAVRRATSTLPMQSGA
jgi:pimeloyl-ACP methyl ester carboxylesterase